MTGRNDQGAHAAWPVSVITDARAGASIDQARRQKRYMITMGFRTLCFVCMIFVPGVWRWILFAGAVLLPYVAVLFANQADQKGSTGKPVEAEEPEARPQLTTSDAHIIHIEPDEDDIHVQADVEDVEDDGPRSAGDGRRVA